MALSKSKTLANGATGDYWRIMAVTVDKASTKVTYMISLFTNSTIAGTNAPSLGLTKVYSFNYTHDELVGNLLSIGYDKIKTKAETTVTVGINGEPLGSPQAFDPDLDGATDV